MDSRVRAALCIRRVVFDQLWAVSRPASGRAGAPLPPANDRAVEIRGVSAGALAPIAGPGTEATIIRADDRYVIFVAVNPSSQIIPGLLGESLERFLVLREYARIGLGEVFEDNPMVLLQRWAKPATDTTAEQAAVRAAHALLLQETEGQV